MKLMKALSMLALVAVVAVGCGKTEKILPKKDGLWDVTKVTTRYYTGGNLDSTETYSDAGTYRFETDGTGVITEDGGATQAFEWTANDDAETVKICYDFLGIQVCMTYDVNVSEKNHQEWSFSQEDGNDRTEQELILDRAE